MATKEKIVAAVDIGTTKIVSLVGRLNEQGKLEVLEFPPPPNIGTNNYDFDSLTPVHVVNQPVKTGWRDGVLYVEVHPAAAEAELADAVQQHPHRG